MARINEQTFANSIYKFMRKCDNSKEYCKPVIIDGATVTSVYFMAGFGGIRIEWDDADMLRRVIKMVELKFESENMYVNKRITEDNIINVFKDNVSYTKQDAAPIPYTDATAYNIRQLILALNVCKAAKADFVKVYAPVNTDEGKFVPFTIAATGIIPAHEDITVTCIMTRCRLR